MALDDSKRFKHLKVSSTRLKLHYRVGYIQHLYRNLRSHHSHLAVSQKSSKITKFINTAQSAHLKLAPSAPIRRPKRPSSPNTNQSPEPNSPPSNQTSRSLTLTDANHALGILSFSLALRVHDTVYRAANTKIRRRLDDKWQIARVFPKVAYL